MGTGDPWAKRGRSNIAGLSVEQVWEVTDQALWAYSKLLICRKSAVKMSGALILLCLSMIQIAMQWNRSKTMAEMLAAPIREAK
jgi:hypothetical protein